MSPTLGQLIGEWTLQSTSAWSGVSSQSMHFYPDGRVVHRVIQGNYPANSPAGISARETFYGRIRTTAPDFLVEADSMVTEDPFYGLGHREVRYTEIHWWLNEPPLEATVRQNLLTFDYLTYPEDKAPANALRLVTRPLSLQRIA